MALRHFKNGRAVGRMQVWLQASGVGSASRTHQCVMNGVDRRSAESDVCRMKRVQPGDPRVAVAYLRASTEDQKLSPEAQRATILAWAVAERIEVAAWHLDQGKSGGDDIADRPALVAALADLRPRGAGVLVVLKRDRLARDPYIALGVDRAAKAHGARVMSADGAGNGDDAAAAFMRHILDAAAAYERALIQQRTKDALAVKRARGERAGSVPLGFHLAADGKMLERDEREQSVVREVHELRAGGMSMVRIAGKLNATGTLPRSGRRWYPAQVARMLGRVV